jgi:predicted nucleic acid-binding protein
MPSRKTRFAVFDTSVYIENFRTGRFARQILESTFVPRCSAVVLHELLRGARTPVERQLVRDLRRHCRVVTPMERHWIDAAEILARIKDREGYDALLGRILQSRRVIADKDAFLRHRFESLALRKFLDFRIFERRFRDARFTSG